MADATRPYGQSWHRSLIKKGRVDMRQTENIWKHANTVKRKNAPPQKTTIQKLAHKLLRVFFCMGWVAVHLFRAICDKTHKLDFRDDQFPDLEATRLHPEHALYMLYRLFGSYSKTCWGVCFLYQSSGVAATAAIKHLSEAHKCLWGD